MRLREAKGLKTSKLFLDTPLTLPHPLLPMQEGHRQARVLALYRFYPPSQGWLSVHNGLGASDPLSQTWCSSQTLRFCPHRRT